MSRRIIQYGIPVLMLISLVLAGCVGIPAQIKGGMTPPTQNFISVKNMPQSFMNQEVRFGGQVLSVTNTAQYSRLVVASMPLDDEARPILGSPSQGRFIVYANRFLDPVDYTGWYITVLGTVKGTEQGRIDTTPYTFLAINALGLQRWNVTQEVMYPVGGSYWVGPWDSYYYPYSYGYPYGPGWGPVQFNTILTE